MGKIEALKPSQRHKKVREIPLERKELGKARGSVIPRIDEEKLFRLFTADIIKLKTKFTR